jgi:hypothetical protein
MMNFLRIAHRSVLQGHCYAPMKREALSKTRSPGMIILS